MAYVVFPGFTRGEYHVIRVDFICSSRGVIRKLRLAYVVCIAFFNEEYLIALVDFIVALRRTKGRGRRTLRSPPSPSSGLHLIHPGLSAAAGKCRLPRAYTNLGIWYQVQIAYPQFRIWFCYLCSGLYRSRFSRVVGLGSFVFHYWWGRSFVPAATWCFAFSFVGFALTAGRSFLWADNVTGWSVSLVA